MLRRFQYPLWCALGVLWLIADGERVTAAAIDPSQAPTVPFILFLSIAHGLLVPKRT